MISPTNVWQKLDNGVSVGIHKYANCFAENSSKERGSFSLGRHFRKAKWGGRKSNFLQKMHFRIFFAFFRNLPFGYHDFAGLYFYSHL